MKAVKAFLFILSAAALMCMYDMFFTVSEYEQAVITRFGMPIESVRESGLHLKIPFIDRVARYEKRSLVWDSGLLEIPDREGTMMSIDVAARWRIVDPMRFLQTVGTYEGAYARLDDAVDSIVKDKVSGNSLPELVRSSELIDGGNVGEDGAKMLGPAENEAYRKVVPGRQRVALSIRADASKYVSSFGAELLDLKFKRMGYAGSSSGKVFERMVSERRYMAARLKSEGEGRRAEILGMMERELRAIRSEAFKSAEEIRGRADADAAGIYGRAYSRDPEFAAFFTTIQTYRDTPLDNTTLILGTDSEFYRFLKGAKK